jgi:hypothetical protein
MNPDETLDTPGKDRLPDGEPSEQEIRDSSDVLKGEIGNARLKEPSDGEDTGADLSQLPKIDAGPTEGTLADADERGGSI